MPNYEPHARTLAIEEALGKSLTQENPLPPAPSTANCQPVLAPVEKRGPVMPVETGVPPAGTFKNTKDGSTVGTLEKPDFRLPRCGIRAAVCAHQDVADKLATLRKVHGDYLQTISDFSPFLDPTAQLAKAREKLFSAESPKEIATAQRELDQLASRGSECAEQSKCIIAKAHAKLAEAVDCVLAAAVPAAEEIQRAAVADETEFLKQHGLNWEETPVSRRAKIAARELVEFQRAFAADFENAKIKITPTANAFSTALRWFAILE